MSAIMDYFRMYKRCNKISFRSIDALLISILLPVMMMILFVYLFGGAMDVGDVLYVNYVVPGVLIIAVGYNASMAGVAINQDMTKGVIDRFQTMPINKFSVLMGHVFASISRNLIVLGLVIGVALLIGFRPEADTLQWLLALIMIVLYMLTITFASIAFGLMAKSAEGAGSFGFFILFLPYLSSAFVPTSTMPTVLRVISENSPLTPIIETLRSLFIDASVGNYVRLSFIWIFGLLTLSLIFACRMYSKKLRG